MRSGFQSGRTRESEKAWAEMYVTLAAGHGSLGRVIGRLARLHAPVGPADSKTTSVPETRGVRCAAWSRRRTAAEKNGAPCVPQLPPMPVADTGAVGRAPGLDTPPLVNQSPRVDLRRGGVRAVVSERGTVPRRRHVRVLTLGAQITEGLLFPDATVDLEVAPQSPLV